MLRHLSHRVVQAIDVAVIAWVVLSVVLGFAVARRVNELGALGDGLVNAGNAVTDVGAGLGELADVPLVGVGISGIADQIEGIGQAAVDRGEQGKSAVLRLAFGLGLLFTLVLAFPVLVIWIPTRLIWERDRREIRVALAADDAVQAYLANRVAATYPYRRLATVSTDPWGDIRKGNCGDLAALEIERLGLADDRPSGGL